MGFRVSRQKILGGLISLTIVTSIWVLARKHITEVYDGFSIEEYKPLSGTKENYPKNYDVGMDEIKEVLNAVADIEPDIESLQDPENYKRFPGDDLGLMGDNELPPTSGVLGLYLQVSDEDVEELKKTHKQVMDELPDSIIANSSEGRGIVMTGGGHYFPMALTAIQWIRNRNITLPIEVFMSDESEYEPHICDGLFPELNVECRVLRDIYGQKLSEKLDSKYALKPMSILASKFEDIYMMDVDSYPMFDLNEIFDWSVYNETGMILNSDYWPRLIQPKYYEISGTKLGGRARGDPNCKVVLQSDRENAVPGQSTESGQIFVRKSTHIKSLLLTMYYNLYGPLAYFPLLMQKGPGEGDKDTYATAAHICNETYYQTQEGPFTLGHHKEDGSYTGYVMVQPDPITDYARYMNNQTDLESKYLAFHSNQFKANPKYMLQSHDEPMRGAPPLRQQRIFSKLENVQNGVHTKEDLEKTMFESMVTVACEWADNRGYVPNDWNGEDLGRMCRILQHHTEWLGNHPSEEVRSDAAFWIDLE